jgi:plastocyanin
MKLHTTSFTLFTAVSLIGLLAGASACSSAPPPAPPTPPASAGKKVDAATAGSIAGKVTFDGAQPAAEKIKMTTDPNCVTNAGPNPQSDAVLVGADKSVKNAFVYIKAGLDSGYTFDTPKNSVVLSQVGCIYTPRVVGLQVGQSIDVVNGDNTLHNVHALPMQNQEFNQGQQFRGMKLTKTFTVPEVMVRFKCDVHGWMAAWVGVTTHPFFAVTGADGTFELKGVPPGTYTVEAWHEKFGFRTTQVTVGPSQAQTASFTFTADNK